MLAGFHDRGIGVGLRPTHFSAFEHGAPSSVSWVEVIAENYLDWDNRENGRPLQRLKKIRENVPVALHGVSLSIGSVDPISQEYLAYLKKLSREIEPLWVSDHLCWTTYQGKNLHDLLPLPYTEEAIELVSRKITQVQDILGRQILLENVSSYLQFASSSMPEWEFLGEIVRRADCGILLDVNNIYVNSVNHNFNPLMYLQHLPRERVCQIHLAGHTVKDGYLIDTHDNFVCDEVWDLYEWSVKNIGLVSSMIEWDADIPAWDTIEGELNKISSIRKKYELPSNARVAAAEFCQLSSPE